MSLNEQYNIGAKLKGKAAIAVSVVSASSAGPTTQDGVAIDRQASGMKQYYSCRAVVGAISTAGSSLQTVSIGMNFQHADSSGGTWASYSTGTVPSTVTIGSTSTGNSQNTTGGQYGEIEQSVSLVGAKRWVRVQVTAPSFATSSSGSSVILGGVVVFGGGDDNT